MKIIPDELQQVANSLVAHVNQGSPIPKKLFELVHWFETEGLEDLIAAWENEEVAMKLGEFARTRFTDRNVIENEDCEGPITNTQRLAFARKLIANYFCSYDDGWIIPSIHIVKLENRSGACAFLGWLLEIHGQGGEAPLYRGVFSSKESFFASLREANFLLMSEQHLIDDLNLLALWQH
jgi:hypothetical protein